MGKFTFEQPKGYEALTDNYEALNALMGSLELSGVFSNELLKKVYGVCYKTIATRENLHDGYITYELAEEKLREFQADFEKIFSVYNIFSQEFSSHLWGLYHTVCWYHMIHPNNLKAKQDAKL